MCVCLAIRHDNAALACGDGLHGMEAEYRHIRMRADRFAAISGTKRLRGVLDKDQLMLFCERAERAQVCRSAAVIHRYDRLRPLCYLFSRIDDTHVPAFRI